MNPLKALFGKEERFLSNIEASAEEGWVGDRTRPAGRRAQPAGGLRSPAELH